MSGTWPRTSRDPPAGKPPEPIQPPRGDRALRRRRDEIRGAEAWLDRHPEFTGDVVTVIQTDGEENSSRTGDLDEVNRLISEKTQQGWEFVFQGTGQAAWTEAEKFTSIPVSARFAGGASAGAHAEAYASSSRAMSRKRMTGERYEDSLRAEGMPDESHQP